MHRRSILAGLAALALPRRATGAAPSRVIVIGAGLCGLSVVWQLSRGGHEVTVLEARDRIGGRVHTARPSPDLPAEMGAGWIHGGGRNPVLGLARDTGSTPVAFDRAAFVIGPGRQMEDWDDTVGARLLTRALTEAEDHARDLSVMDALMGSDAWQDASDAERDLALRLLRTEIEPAYGGSPTTST